ncbi:MAG: hypothetical protein ABR540_12145 [Acidimicrobiales bacterium]
MPDIPLSEPPPDPALEALRSLPDRYRAVLAGDRDRADPAELAALEEAARTRDVLGAAAQRVERLLEDSRPVSDAVPPGGPRRGPTEWDPEVVLEIMDTNAERVARLVGAIPESAGDRVGVREGLESITHEIVNEAASEGERSLRNSERVVGGTPNGADRRDPRPDPPSR